MGRRLLKRILLFSVVAAAAVGSIAGTASGDGNGTYGCNLPSRSGTYWDAWYTQDVKPPASPDRAARIDQRGNNDNIVCQLQIVGTGEWTHRLTDNTG
jgi:hypothetical protein